MQNSPSCPSGSSFSVGFDHFHIDVGQGRPTSRTVRRDRLTAQTVTVSGQSVPFPDLAGSIARFDESIEPRLEFRRERVAAAGYHEQAREIHIREFLALHDSFSGVGTAAIMDGRSWR